MCVTAAACHLPLYIALHVPCTCNSCCLGLDFHAVFAEQIPGAQVAASSVAARLAQVPAERSAAGLAYHLAPRAAVPSEAGRAAQATEQSAQRSGWYLTSTNESFLLWIDSTQHPRQLTLQHLLSYCAAVCSCLSSVTLLEWTCCLLCCTASGTVCWPTCMASDVWHQAAAWHLPWRVTLCPSPSACLP